jgi:hypothetical protein
MNKKHLTIDQALAQWGISQYQLPRGNEALKDQILQTLKSDGPNSPSKRRGLFWIPTLAVAATVFVFVVLLSQNSARYKSIPNDSASIAQNSSGLRYQESAPGFDLGKLDLFQSAPPEVPIADTREFLKTDYGAQIRTRKVPEFTERLQTIVRGFDGRVDNVSSSKQTGSISFVVPASKFESFRSEVKTMVGSRFYVETVHSANLLSEKVSIEEQQAKIEKSLSDLNAQKDQITKTYNETIKTLQSQLNSINQRLSYLQTQWDSYPEQRSELESQIKATQRDQSILNNRLATEKNNYASSIAMLDAQIKEWENQRELTNKANQGLLDTVATVRGNITVSKLSAWQFVGAYLPEYWPIYIATLAILAALILHRRRNRFIL